MAARNKPVIHCNVFGLQPARVKLDVQAGTSQQIKIGEICNMHDYDIATHPIVPAVDHDVDFIPVIADQEQAAGDAARKIQFIRPTQFDRFYFDITSTSLKNGDLLEIHDSQTVEKGTGYPVLIVDDPDIGSAGKTVTNVRCAFLQVSAAGLHDDPYIGARGSPGS